MADNEQPDYIFIECNCDHAFEKTDNNDRWINRIDGGITIPENSKLSVQYAGINILGSGSDVIEFKNEKIGQSEIYKYNETTELYDKTKYDVFDNKVTLFLEFYKNQDGLYNYTLPFPYFDYPIGDVDNYCALGNNKNVENEEPQKGIETSNYNSVYNYAFPIDNKRYTILKRNPNSEYLSNTESGRVHLGVAFYRDQSNYEYSVYNNEVEIEIDKGFQSPSTIAESISQQLEKHSEVKEKTMRCWLNNTDMSVTWPNDYVDIQGGITTETETFKLFNTATRRTFYKFASEEFNDLTEHNNKPEVQQYQKNFEYIGCYNPSVFLSGRLIQKDLSYDGKAVTNVFLNKITSAGTQQSEMKEFNMYLNLPYDENILKQFKYLFDYQRGDSELYENKVAKFTFSTPENSVFLHVDCLQQSYTSLTNYKVKRFGTDYAEDNQQRKHFTNPLYLAYDRTQGNTFQGDSAYGVFYPWETNDHKFYCMVKGRFWINAEDPLNTYFEFYTNGANTFGGEHPNAKEDYTVATFPRLAPTTYSRIGWDRHFSAQGNQCIMLWNGLKDTSELSVSAVAKPTVEKTTNIFQNSFLLNNDNSKEYFYDTGNDQIYLGADSFIFNFQDSRFTMSQLHTSRKQFNNALSGFDASILRNVAVDDKTGQPQIYYLPADVGSATKIQFPLGINPNGNTGIYEISPTLLSTSTQEVAENYNALKTNTIFDSNCGVFFSFFGIDDKTYENSLWDILGFSKAQTHTYLTNEIQLQEILYRSNRFLNNGVNLKEVEKYPFTTNAEINSNEIISWRANPFNISYFNTLNIPNNFRVIQGDTASGNFTFDDNVSPYRVVQNQISTTMFAEKLPRKTNIPFFQVRSDILPMVKYYGGNEQSNGRLPVLSLVNKSFSGTDYFVNQGDNSMEFIIKRRITINSVVTEIFDNNGRPAILDPHSSVIYKFEVPYRPPQITPFSTSIELQEAEEQQLLKKNSKKK